LFVVAEFRKWWKYIHQSSCVLVVLETWGIWTKTIPDLQGVTADSAGKWGGQYFPSGGE
jgi:hypothetical protein